MIPHDSRLMLNETVLGWNGAKLFGQFWHQAQLGKNIFPDTTHYCVVLAHSMATTMWYSLSCFNTRYNGNKIWMIFLKKHPVYLNLEIWNPVDPNFFFGLSLQEAEKEARPNGNEHWHCDEENKRFKPIQWSIRWTIQRVWRDWLPSSSPTRETNWTMWIFPCHYVQFRPTECRAWIPKFWPKKPWH